MRRIKKDGTGSICKGASTNTERRGFWKTAMKRVCAAAILVFYAWSGPAFAQGGTLMVQLVESGWLPVPTMDVHLTSVTTCAGSGRATSRPTVITTNKSGYATFSVPGKGFYSIEVPKQGEFGFARKRICIELFDFAPEFPTAYVQIKLGFSGPPIVVR
jgi:hypothetical protein